MVESIREIAGEKFVSGEKGEETVGQRAGISVCRLTALSPLPFLLREN